MVIIFGGLFLYFGFVIVVLNMLNIVVYFGISGFLELFIVFI